MHLGALGEDFLICNVHACLSKFTYRNTNETEVRVVNLSSDEVSDTSCIFPVSKVPKVLIAKVWQSPGNDRHRHNSMYFFFYSVL